MLLFLISKNSRVKGEDFTQNSKETYVSMGSVLTVFSLSETKYFRVSSKINGIVGLVTQI